LYNLVYTCILQYIQVYPGIYQWPILIPLYVIADEFVIVGERD
jgi:hypothetical protein